MINGRLQLDRFQCQFQGFFPLTQASVLRSQEHPGEIIETQGVFRTEFDHFLMDTNGLFLLEKIHGDYRSAEQNTE